MNFIVLSRRPLYKVVGTRPYALRCRIMRTRVFLLKRLILRRAHVEWYRVTRRQEFIERIQRTEA